MWPAGATELLLGVGGSFWATMDNFHCRFAASGDVGSRHRIFPAGVRMLN